VVTKAIIEVDIRDEKFQRFRELFDRYTAELAKTPNAWKAVSKESAGMATQFERMSAALMAQNALTAETKDAEDKRHKVLSANEQLWSSMAKSSGVIAKHSLDIGTRLLKWGAILGGGLLGGSLWGIDKMAAGVSESRRSAMGLGLSIGEQKSFNINFERLLDPNFLSQVAEMKMDPSKAGPLYTMGVGTGGSTEDTAVALVKAMRSKAQSTRIDQLGLLDKMTGLNAGTEEWRRLHDMGTPEFNQLLAGNKSGVGALGLDDATAKKWQDFTTQMQKAGTQIENVFVKGLVKLAGPLENLSKSLVSFIEALSKSGIAKEAVDTVSGWLDSFSTKIGNGDFLKKVEQFTGDLSGLSDAVHAAISDPAGTAENLAGKAISTSFNAGPLGFLGGGSGLGSWLTSLWNPQKGKSDWLSTLDSKYQLPQGSLDYIWQSASSRGTNRKSFSAGDFQLTGDAAKGVDRQDFGQSSERVAKMIHEELQRYGGDIVKAIAAYKIGEGGVDKAVKQYGKDWQRHVPYVAKIKIENATGGSAHVSVNALAGGQ
jgi:hypothetical protein